MAEALNNVETLTFGPVPSRRLGRSLGINNVPAKTCSYSCVYCQIGQTTNMSCGRRVFYNPEIIVTEVKRRISRAKMRSETIDYLTFVPDGEPTLDVNLGDEIGLLKQTGIQVAVLSNASLIWQKDVRRALQKSDFVSLKIDAVSETIWRRINRPHKDLKLELILKGIATFANKFKGILTSETMLIDKMFYGDEFERIAEFLGNLKKLDRAYIAVPTRPPVESWVEPAQEEKLNKAFQAFSDTLGFDRVEYLLGYEGDSFAFMGRVEEDLLSIMAVHPMRKEAIDDFLKKAKADWSTIEKLVDQGMLIQLEYGGNSYYMRKMPGDRSLDRARMGGTMPD